MELLCPTVGPYWPEDKVSMDELLVVFQNQRGLRCTSMSNLAGDDIADVLVGRGLVPEVMDNHVAAAHFQAVVPDDVDKTDEQDADEVLDRRPKARGNAPDGQACGADGLFGSCYEYDKATGNGTCGFHLFT